ncbi:DNA-dependent protein kinase catalytic subunit-like [Zophobas morio]|uniref:DNA-dependent protein kinase catalytic subunit-like n=1 Tax=Zophobas morio TaxID=2755281 RepID=UPI003083E847
MYCFCLSVLLFLTPFEVELSAFETFYLATVKLIAENAAKEFTGEMSSAVLDALLTNKMKAFELVRVLYSVAPVSFVHSQKSTLVSTFCAPQEVVTGKELTMHLVKAAHTAKTVKWPLAPAKKENKLMYYQTAYNALAEIVMRTQNKIEFYSGFLFEEHKARGQLVFERLVDLDHTWIYPVQLDAPSSFVRTNRCLSQGQAVSDPSNHVLIHSSLSVDASMFSAFSQLPGMLEEVYDGSQQLTLDKYELPEMPADLINQNMCMPTLLAVIDRIEYYIMSTSKMEEPPLWMVQLLKKMSVDTHINVRLFVAKLVCNRPGVFSPFANTWTKHFLRLVLDYARFCGNGINLFMVEMFSVILSWFYPGSQGDILSTAVDPTYSDRAVFSEVFEFLLKNSHEEKTTNNNLLLLRMLVEIWKDHLDVPTQLLYDWLTESNSPRMNLLGVQVTGMVLVNEVSGFLDRYMIQLLSHCS